MVGGSKEEELFMPVGGTEQRSLCSIVRTSFPPFGKSVVPTTTMREKSGPAYDVTQKSTRALQIT